MKKFFIIAMLLVLSLTSTAYAGHGGCGRGGRGGNTYNYYGNRGCGWSGNQFWGSFAGGAAGALVAGILTAPQQPTMVVERVTTVEPVYVVPTYRQYRTYYVNGVEYREEIRQVIRCPKCGRNVDCATVAPGNNAQCPVCLTILY